MARLICCSLAVEVKGRALHPDKSAKEHGIRIKEARDYGLPAVLVLGYKRSLSFTVKEVRQVVDSRLSAGRLAFVSQDGTQVLATKALEEELKEVVKVLRWQVAAPPCPLSQSAQSLQSGASVNRLRAGLRRAEVSTATAGAVAEAVAKAKGADTSALSSRAAVAESALVAVNLERSKRLKAGPETRGSGSAAALSPRAGLESLPSTVLSIIWEMEPSDGPWRRVAESCSQLAAFFDEQNWTFRLNSRAKGVTLDSSRILQLLSRRPGRRVVDLSGFRELTAGAGTSLADTLSGGLGSQLERLVLRGCRLLTDVAVRRMLSACPQLQVLDVLEIPRLSSRAFEAPLPRLRVLAAGSLGGAVTAERPRWGTEVDRGALTNISGVVGSSLAKPRQKAAAALGSVQITALLLNRLSQRPSLADGATGAAIGASGGAPLTHVILAHCAEIRVLPRLPASLVHLDLRGANIEVPEASLQSWRPLAACPKLHSLCLAGNDLLSSTALQACLASLPPAARLQALDLSGTRLQGPLLAQLPQLQPSITHLSIAGCAATRNSCVAGVLSRLRELKVLDISGCAGLEMPFASIVDSVKADAGVAEGASEERTLVLAHLQLVGLGRTELGAHLEETRRALHVVAPSARVLASSVDIFARYEVLPPVLL